MIRFQQPDRGSVDEEKKAARILVYKNIAFFIAAIAVIRITPNIIRALN